MFNLLLRKSICELKSIAIGNIFPIDVKKISKIKLISSSCS